MTDDAPSPLHLVFSPTGFDALRGTLTDLNSNAVIVFLNDAVSMHHRAADTSLVSYVLEEDLIIRGLSVRRPDEVRRLTMADLVELTTRHQPIVSWR
ncbi:MAG: DsrH/TusB family sulfur metabolism protein [Pseudomonadota bacterium]